MPENRADALAKRAASTEPASLRCGDCHAPLAARSAASPAASGAEEAGDFYCHACAKDLSTALICDACGSAVCPVCGTPVELADDLGMG